LNLPLFIVISGYIGIDIRLPPFECNNFEHLHLKIDLEFTLLQNTLEWTLDYPPLNAIISRLNLEFTLNYNDFRIHQNGHWIIPL
jgi:hypothetical protein